MIDEKEVIRQLKEFEATLTETSEKVYLLRKRYEKAIEQMLDQQATREGERIWREKMGLTKENK